MSVTPEQVKKLREMSGAPMMECKRALDEAQFAPKAGLSSYYSARLRYELALIAYKQRRFDDTKHQLESALALAIQDPELLRVIERLKVLVDQATTL